MGFPESMPADRSPGRRPRWTVIAFYVGLLLLVAWLKYSSSSDGVPQGQFPTSVPATAPDRERRSAEQDVARDDWTPKSRVLRNDAPAAENNERESPVAAPAHASERSESAPRQSDARDDGLLIHNVGVIDENHRVVYRGDVDLAPTLKRIESGRRLRFYHDGIVFENREHRLPAKPSGYYHEFVQPTPGDNGPGAQRVVLGAEDEVFYSSDHYRSFRRVR